MQSRQHMQPGTASMHCNQSMYADRHKWSGIQEPGGLAGREPHGILERSLHKMSGQHRTQGWRGPHRSRSFCGARFRSYSILPGIAHGDAKRPGDEDVARIWTMLQEYPAVGLS